MLKRAISLFKYNPDYDVLVIGGGPGGYYAAIRSAQLGMKTACIEKRGALGGTCLNVGCIPSKVLLNASSKLGEVKSWKKFGFTAAHSELNLQQLMEFKSRTVSGLTRGIETLFKKYGATYVKGQASFVSENVVEVTSTESGGGQSYQLSAKNIIIATGSEPSPFPGKAELKINGTSIVTSDDAIAFDSVPKDLVVVGGGVIGLELGSVWARLGSKVTVLEHSTHALSGADSELANFLVKSMTKNEGIQFVNNCEVEGIDGTDRILYSQKSLGKNSLPFDKLLVATGRRPVTTGLNLESIDVMIDKRRGYIQVNDKMQTTSHSHIYAIGDVAPGPMLAHKAEEEGMAVVDYIHGGSAVFPNHLHIPSVVYSHPEVAWVGHREDDLISMGTEYRKGSFPFLANSRARCNGNTEGFVKILVDSSTDKIIGAHIVSPHAGELISPLVLAITYGATSKDVAMTSFAHPTENEAIKEACLAAHFKSIHF